MAEIEFLPLPPQASSSEGSGSQQVESVKAILDGAVSSPPAAPNPGTTSFRQLTPEEITREALPDYQRSGNSLPDPAVSTFIGAFAPDGKVSYVCLQLKLHAQPLVLRPGHQSLLPGLVHAAEAHILATVGPQWVYLFSPAGRLATIAQSMGMQLEPWVVLSKLVTPEFPTQSPLEIVPGEPDILPTQEEMEHAYQEAKRGGTLPITTEELDQYPGTDYQSRGDESAWDGLFPNGVLPIDPSGRVQ